VYSYCIQSDALGAIQESFCKYRYIRDLWRSGASALLGCLGLTSYNMSYVYSLGLRNEVGPLPYCLEYWELRRELLGVEGCGVPEGRGWTGSSQESF